ncbi:hypothetical protein Pfo_011609 [Paulownia fortunei]|nr:hypothetical protein Pfo_011609 [Paulownia fortunei]
MLIAMASPLGYVHSDGDYHRAVHVRIFTDSTQELLLQLCAECKDFWQGLWDISSADHISVRFISCHSKIYMPFAFIGGMSIEMVITIELFMCGYLLRAHKNSFKYVLNAMIAGRGFGTFLVLVISQPEIHLLSQQGIVHPFVDVSHGDFP